MRGPTQTGSKRPLSRRAGIPVVLGFVLLLAGCTSSGLSTSGSPTPTTDVVTDGGPSQEPSETHTDVPAQPPELESVLYGLVTADNRTAYAANRDLTLREGRVEVTFELQPGTEIPPAFDLTVETRHEELVQAFVPVSELIPLAEHENVKFVRAPRRPVPDEPSTTTTDT